MGPPVAILPVLMHRLAGLEKKYPEPASDFKKIHCTQKPRAQELFVTFRIQ